MQIDDDARIAVEVQVFIKKNSRLPFFLCIFVFIVIFAHTAFFLHYRRILPSLLFTAPRCSVIAILLR